MTVKQKLTNFVKNITVEPVFLLFSLGTGLIFVINQNLYYDKVTYSFIYL